MRNGLCAIPLFAVLVSLACDEGGPVPTPGAPEFQHPGFVRVFGNASVNAANGNLLLERDSISIDTLLGTQVVRAVYNSATGWRWDFQMHYADGAFIDASGAVHDLSTLADGAPVPGTIWRRLDDRTLATRGGLAYHFREDGSLEHVRWASLDQPRVQYVETAGPGGNGIAVQQCSAASVCTSFYQIDLDPDGRPLSITGRRTGRVAQLSYDAQGRLVKIRRPFEVEAGLAGETFEYDGGSQRIRALTSSEGDRVEIRYRASAPFRVREVWMVGEGDPRQSFRYAKEGDGFRTTYTNPLGGVTELGFDAKLRLRESCRIGLSLCSHFAWQGRRLSSRSTESGATTTFVWEDDQLVERRDPSGNVTRFAYEPGGLDLTDPLRPAVRRIEDSVGVVEERSYDPEGRPVSIRTGDDVLFVSYSGARARTLTVPGFPPREFPVRGVHGHWLEAEVAGLGADSRLYDPVGNPVVDSVRVGEGGYLTRSYDGDRRLATVEMAASDASGLIAATAPLSVIRRSDHQPLLVARPGGNDHEFVYDALGRNTLRRERVDGTWHEVAFTWDAAGNPTSRTLPNGMRQEVDYDPYGRVTEVRSLRDGAVEGFRTLSYDPESGLLATDFDSKRGGATTLYHDPVTREEATRRHEGGEWTIVVRDARSRVVRRIYATAALEIVVDLTIEYDLSDRITRLRDTGTGQVLLGGAYAGGVLAQLSYGNGLTRNIERDDLGRIQAMQVVDEAGAVVAATTVERSFESGPPRRQQVANTVSTPLATTKEEFWLPIGDSIVDPSAFVGKRVFHWSNGLESEDYAWDANNNLVGPTYNGDGSRLTSAGGVDYAYDAAGFVVERGGVPLEWDANGRIARVGGTVFEWDMRGAPIAITEAGTPVREFRLFGGALESTSETPLAFSWGPLRIDLVTGAKRYAHYDFRGNVSFVTDDSGGFVAHFSYRPFGLDRAFGAASSQGTFARAWAFGPLLLMGTRVYDPQVGRFLSQDPLFQLTSQYAYAQGNPVDFLDSSGMNTVSNDTYAAMLGFAGGLVAATVGGPIGPAVAFSAGTYLLINQVLTDLGVAPLDVLTTRAGAAAIDAVGNAAADVADGIGAALDAFASGRSPGGPGAGGGGGSGGGGSSSGGAPPVKGTVTLEIEPDVPAFGSACSPARLTALPDGLPWLPFLVAINALLGLAVLQRRRRSR